MIAVGFFFLEYIGVFCVKLKLNLGPTCLREHVRIKKKAKNASVLFVFTRFTVDGGRVSHGLVLVFAATCRRLALRAPRIIEQGIRHVEFCFVHFGQTITYVIFRMIASKLKGNVHDVIIF